MNNKVFWTALAFEDLEQIIEYLKISWSSDIALKFLDRIEQRIQLISELPKIYPIINQKHEIRKCVLSNNTVLYYRLKFQRIHILRIYNTKRNPKNLEFDISIKD